MTTDPVIQAKHLGKRYDVTATRPRHDTLRDLIMDRASALVRGRALLRRPERVSFWALKDASFEIRAGENVGLIGLNGAGKSTLLKLLSRITEPTVGTARIQGRMSTLLEVGTGFHSELSGRENIYLNGSILGMSRLEIDRKYEAILDFSGIGAMIHTPVKRYSSGMYVRLAFSVAAHVEPDILFLDEVLAVGDLSFQRKCMEFTKQLQVQRRATILLVSHNMSSIKAMCDRVIYLRRGEILFDGPADDGIRRYHEDCRADPSALVQQTNAQRAIVVTELVLRDEHGVASTVFDYGTRMRLRLRYEVQRPIQNPNFIIAILRSDGIACCNFSTEADGVQLGQVRDGGTVELLTPPLKLVAELYTIHVLVRENGFQGVLCNQVGPSFHVQHELFDTHFGVFHESARWCICDEAVSVAQQR